MSRGDTQFVSCPDWWAVTRHLTPNDNIVWHPWGMTDWSKGYLEIRLEFASMLMIVIFFILPDILLLVKKRMKLKWHTYLCYLLIYFIEMYVTRIWCFISIENIETFYEIYTLPNSNLFSGLG